MASRRCQDGIRFRLVGSPNQSVQSGGKEVALEKLTRLLTERTSVDYFPFCHTVSFYSLPKGKFQMCLLRLKDEAVFEVIRQYLEDREDYREAIAALERREPTITLDELERQMGIDS